MSESEVRTADVQEALKAALKRMTIPLIAELSGASERTLYRIKDGEYESWMELDQADRILIACDGDLVFCETRTPAAVE